MNLKSTTLGTNQYSKKDKMDDEFDKFKASLGVCANNFSETQNGAN